MRFIIISLFIFQFLVALNFTSCASKFKVDDFGHSYVDVYYKELKDTTKCYVKFRDDDGIHCTAYPMYQGITYQCKLIIVNTTGREINKKECTMFTF